MELHGLCKTNVKNRAIETKYIAKQIFIIKLAIYIYIYMYIYIITSVHKISFAPTFYESS